MKSENLQMVIAFVLVVVILFIWQFLFLRRQPQNQTVAAAPAPAQPTPPTPAGPQKQLPASQSPLPETTITLQNDFLSLELTSRGGGLKQTRLIKFGAELVPADSILFGSQVQIQDRSYDLACLPVTIGFADSSVTFSYEIEGMTITKTWRLGRDYTLALSVASTGPVAALTLDCQAGIATTEQNLREDLANFHFYARRNGKVHQLSHANLRKRQFGGPADWVGIKSKYFFLALVNEHAEFDSTQALALDDGRIGFWARTGFDDEIAGSRAQFLIYLGPIEYNRLRSFRLGFENVVSLGWLKPVALGILWLLRLFYSLFRNWGVAILFFSVLMKAAFYPLTRTQTRQMRQMQLLQPKLEELKRKFQDDPKMLNEETMRLYRLYRINPLSGCLPLLVQMPIFFALYAVLRTFIELRGARFILWLKDLSQPDTLFGHLPRGLPMLGGSAIGLLPILMGVSFIAQNLMTSTDKKNWALTILFPIFITAIFLNLSSGLQLYWFIYNILSILESVVAIKGGSLWRRTKPQTSTTSPPTQTLK
ncbi:MAG: YidC/Oxa1 family insertase periplasmic-domain containing protein [candidate division WOR-3 bacterium]